MSHKTTTLGARLPALLAARGIDTVFGIPGVHTVEMYRGLPQSGLRHITPRHEQGAGFMADGYARVSGKPAACFIISGPGMTNIVTAMGQAYWDSVPMLVISTVNAHGHMGSGEGWLHELPDQSALVSGVAAFSRTIHHPDELERALDDAFAVFQCARPRPVHIEIPLDVLTAEVADRPVVPVEKMTPPGPAKAPFEAALKALTEARTPVILAGGGAKQAHIQQLAEKLDAPVVMTTNARGVMPVGHPLAVPVSPSCAKTRALIAGADVVFAVGTELGPTDYDMYEDGGFAINGLMIRVDLDPKQINRGVRADIALVADAGATVDAIVAALGMHAQNDGASRAAAAREGRDELSAAYQGDLRLLERIRDGLPNTPIVGDSTQIVYAGNMAFEASLPSHYFNSATGYGTLGYGLPAAIGASLATGEHVICISGDGGLQFCLGELASAVEAKAKVILILHDNDGYGEIKFYMQAKDIPLNGVDIFTPDLAKIAEACGWAIQYPTAKTLQDCLEKATACEKPTLLYISETARSGF